MSISIKQALETKSARLKELKAQADKLSDWYDQSEVQELLADMRELIQAKEDGFTHVNLRNMVFTGKATQEDLEEAVEADKLDSDAREAEDMASLALDMGANPFCYN